MKEMKEELLEVIREVICSPRRYFTKEEYNELVEYYKGILKNEVIETKVEVDSTPIGIREIPDYYTGKYKGIRARDIMNDFQLSYNVGTAVTYLLRAGKKEGNSYQQDLEKALHHIVFQLEDLKNNAKK